MSFYRRYEYRPQEDMTPQESSLCTIVILYSLLTGGGLEGWVALNMIDKLPPNARRHFVEHSTGGDGGQKENH